MNTWETYYMYDSKDKISQFWEEYYNNGRDANLLLVLGKGFDPRMNNVLIHAVKELKSSQLSCLSIDYRAGTTTGVDDMYEENVAAYNDILHKNSIESMEVSLDPSVEWLRRIKRMCRDLSQLDLSNFTDIIVDISSLPRSLYFNVIKVLYEKVEKSTVNIFIAVSENVEIDKMIEKTPRSEEIPPLYGFGSDLNIQSKLDQQKILVAIIGEDNLSNLRNVYQQFAPADFCPILPFPSKNPRRSDNLLIEYSEFFDGRVNIEPQDITYADERNPFELYRILENLISHYEKTLAPISKNVCFGIALFSSKLLSLGALLVGLNRNDNVAMFNVPSADYKIVDKEKARNYNSESEYFLLWIKGEPYDE